MDDEVAFLRKLLEQPSNDLTRLVYADWLDEQGTPEATAKAEFLRLIADAELAGRFAERVQALAQKLDSQWLAVVTKLPVENCIGERTSTETEPLARCPKRWEELTPTDDSRVRLCGACKKAVHYCHTFDQMLDEIMSGSRIAVERIVRRSEGDIEEFRSTLYDRTATVHMTLM